MTEIHVNADPAKLEETHTANWSCACDPAAFLQVLSDWVHAPDADLLRERRGFIDAAKGATLPPGNPFAATRASYADALAGLHDALDHGWVVDESVMGSVATVGALRTGDGVRYVGATGGSLGWGTGAAVGRAARHTRCIRMTWSLRHGSRSAQRQWQLTVRGHEQPRPSSVRRDRGMRG